MNAVIKSERPVPRRRATRETSWQAEKSERMRTAVLDATLNCLIDIGYAQTTTEKIAQRAKVSRGAMNHHFKSRAAMFKAAARHITERRAEEFESLIADLKPATHALPTLEDMKQTMHLLQRYYALPSFVALHELQRAARGDKALRRMLVPLEEVLDAKISASIRTQFPYWEAIEGTREVLTDLLHFTLQGVAVNPAPYVDSGRLQHLVDLLASVALREFESAYGSARQRGS